MLASQTLSIRLSEIREKLNAISGIADAEITDEIRAESDTLATEYRASEVKYRSAVIAEDETAAAVVNGDTAEPAEVRERREVRNKTGLRDYLIAACSGAPVTGAAAEFNAACDVAAGDHVPVELFDGPAREMRQAAQRSEHRAITPGPAIDGPVMPTIPYLFEQAVVTTLGLDYPSVESGMPQIPSIGTAPPSSVVAKDGTALATAGAYTLASRSPKRLTGQIEFRVEDLAVHPALESDLSTALQGALSNQLDEQAFNGGGGDDLNGLFNQATNVAATGATDSFALALAAFAAQVDGRFARGMGDIRGVIGPATFAAYMALYHGGSGDMTVYEKIRSLVGSLVVSDRMPAVAAGAQKGLITRNAAGQPIRIYTWASIGLVRDPYSGAGTGKVTVTAVQLISDPFNPHGVNQVIEINRDLS